MLKNKKSIKDYKKKTLKEIEKIKPPRPYIEYSVVDSRFNVYENELKSQDRAISQLFERFYQLEERIRIIENQKGDTQK